MHDNSGIVALWIRRLGFESLQAHTESLGSADSFARWRDCSHDRIPTTIPTAQVTAGAGVSRSACRIYTDGWELCEDPGRCVAAHRECERSVSRSDAATLIVASTDDVDTVQVAAGELIEKASRCIDASTEP